MNLSPMPSHPNLLVDCILGLQLHNLKKLHMKSITPLPLSPFLLSELLLLSFRTLENWIVIVKLDNIMKA